MKSKLIVLFGLCAILALALSACGAPEPLKMENIPLYATAQTTTDAIFVNLSNVMTDAVKTAMGTKLSSIETKVYAAGKATKWDDVQKFYDEQLDKGGWKSDPTLTFNDPSVRGKGWLRGQQAVLIFMASDPNLSDSVLLISLVNTK
ncbi:MAG: hypothetical protein HY070_00320 [Chloroflexi bacterium]|nr:hypothetical protein [Chloroflexota bacterium]